jgi:12-oxophytodienoic acid reductase
MRALGPHRTAVRISPDIDHLDATDSDPEALGLHIVDQLNKRLPELAYLHVTEPRYTRDGPRSLPPSCPGLCRSLRAAFRGPLALSGGFSRASAAAAVASRAADLVSFGRLFVSNPDLPLRLALAAPLNAYDRSTFFTHHPVVGYVDYPPLSAADVLRLLPPPAANAGAAADDHAPAPELSTNPSTSHRHRLLLALLA